MVSRLSKAAARRRVLTLPLVCTFGVVSSTAYEQQGNTLQTFFDEHVDRTLGSHFSTAEPTATPAPPASSTPVALITQPECGGGGGGDGADLGPGSEGEGGEVALVIPAAWLQAINPILILLLTPLLTRFWSHVYQPSTLAKMAVGATLMGASFLFLAAAGMGFENNNRDAAAAAAAGDPGESLARVSIWWVLGHIFVPAFGSHRVSCSCTVCDTNAGNGCGCD